MRRALAATALVIGLAVMPAVPGLADYASGLNAFQRGSYPLAHDEFMRAAQGGDTRAAFMLGELYSKGGQGVVQDFAQAHMWYNLAAAAGNADAAARRDELAARMAPDQLARAQQMAHERQGLMASRAPATIPPVAVMGRSDIIALQRALNDLGYDAGGADGVAGERTRRALRSWQAANGMPATGEITPDIVNRVTTLAAAPPARPAIVATPRPSPRTVTALRRDQVSLVQRELNRAGYDAGSVDGVLGGRTRSAIRAWQRDHGLPVTGEVSEEMMARLQDTRIAVDRLAPAEQALADRGQLPAYTQALQDELARHGYYRGAASGVLTDQLRGSIREYEADAGLPVTGQVSAALLDHLKFARPEVYRPPQTARQR